MPEYLEYSLTDGNVMNLDFPFHFDRWGHTASTDYENHIRDLIEQLLFTNPGERVNRPEFGSGLLTYIFSPNSPELATAIQAIVAAAIDRWLGDLIELQTLEVTSEDATLRVVVQYVLRTMGEAQTTTFSTTVP
jgi:uncharacterized protein